MTELNYRVDYLKQTPEVVAQNFLISRKLLQPARNGNKATIRMGSKIFGEQYILIHMYSLLLKGYTDFKVETKTGLGGTKICFDALINNQIDLYPEYTGTGLLVILNPAKEVVDKMIGSKEQVYNFVKDEFSKRYHLDWLQPIGFNNAYALMMRKQQAEEKQITTISDLARIVKK